MNNILLMVLPFVAGTIIGLLFFGGLWLTVKKALASKIPALWISGSFLLRISITLIGFYYVSQGNWQKLLICLTGFVSARYLVTCFTKEKEENVIIKKEAGLETQS